MTRIVWSNNAQTTLATAITSGATSLSVTAGGGAQFPNPSGGNEFIATIVKAGNANVYEIVLVTASPSADTFTIVRAQEQTAAQAWNAGDYFTLLPTAGGLGAAVQKVDLQAQAPNFANDTGSANAYSVTLNPQLSAHVVGMPIRWIAGHTNTGASTFNDGVGAAPLVLPGGAALVAGQIVAGGMYTAAFDGTNFQIPEIPTNLNSLFQSIINAVYPIGAYALWENDVVGPASQFPWQTWVEVQGVMLVGRQPSLQVNGSAPFGTTGQQGGEPTHQLVVSEVPPLGYRDAYYSEDANLAQPGDLTINIGGINHGIGSQSTDYNNSTAWYRNDVTLSGAASDGKQAATAHNNLPPYRVIRMWRRTA